MRTLVTILVTVVVLFPLSAGESAETKSMTLLK